MYTRRLSGKIIKDLNEANKSDAHLDHIQGKVQDESRAIKTRVQEFQHYQLHQHMHQPDSKNEATEVDVTKLEDESSIQERIQGWIYGTNY